MNNLLILDIIHHVEFFLEILTHKNLVLFSEYFCETLRALHNLASEKYSDDNSRFLSVKMSRKNFAGWIVSGMGELLKKLYPFAVLC